MPTKSSPNSLSSYHRAYAVKTDGSVDVWGSSAGTRKWTDSVTYGDNHRDWRDRLRQGLDATTTMVGSRAEIRYSPGLIRYGYGIPYPFQTVSDTVEGELGHQPELPSGDPSSVDSAKSNAEALGRFYRRMREVTTAFQGGVFLGELGQTLQTIRNPARGLRRSVDDIFDALVRVRKNGLNNVPSRRVADAVKKTVDNLADAWLEKSFGWDPLLHDIDDGCKALAILNTGQSLSTGRITASFTSEADPTHTTVHGGWGNLCARHVYTTVGRCLTVYRGALRLEALNPAEMKAELFGFSPSNFAPTLYELMPWSFLIDYFTNIGDIIEGWSQLSTRLAWCNRTTRKVLNRTSVISSSLAYQKERVPGTNVRTVSCVPAQYVAEKISISRVKIETLSAPPFTFRMPSLGSKKWLNIAALVANRGSDRKWSYGD